MFRRILKRIDKRLEGREKYYLPIFMSSSIFLAIVLVIVSMTLYDKSGAAQLDLSRPGYVDVRAQSITNDNDFKSYSSTGSIDKKSIQEFKKLYDEQSAKAKAVDAFSGDPLNPNTLGISEPASDETVSP